MTKLDRPSIVFAADLHFDETGAWKYRGITGDAQHSFEQIVGFCCEHKANILALGGDILDKPTPRPETIKFLRDQFEKLSGDEVQVVYVLGQHDGRQDWPSIHPDPVHLHGLVYDVDDFMIYGLDYMRPAEFMATYATLQAPSGSFLLCHQVWHEFMGNVRQAELSMAQLPFAMHLLAGDYHVHTELSYKALNGSMGVALSPGSTHVRDVAEEETKRFYAIYNDANPFRVESINLDTRPIRRYQITTHQEAEAFLARRDLPLDGEGIKRAVIDIAYYDDIEGLGAKLANALEDRCHLFLRHRSRRRDERAPSATARRQVADRGLAGAVHMVCEPGPVRDSSVRLLEVADPRIELEAMRNEFYEASSEESV
jgi:predicted MPP superfamily phosphohydrolase